MDKSKDTNIKQGAIIKPDKQDAAAAIATLIRYAGDDPTRPGMAQTAERVLAFYERFFTGYQFDSRDYAASAADGLAFDDFIMIEGITLHSFCEHHMLPATGTACIAYIPHKAVPGLGAVTRLINHCARRFTTQEAITSLIAQRMLEAFGITDIAVKITLAHGCMTLRDAENAKTDVTTSMFCGQFKTDTALQNRFLIMNTQDGNRHNNNKDCVRDE